MDERSLEEAVTDYRARRHKEVCRVIKLRRVMSPANQAFLDRMLADQEAYSSTEISGVLATIGYTVSDATVRKHRLETCLCAR